ncbi:hypothetical protein GGTG_00270 [Gaeumannomyces tritici R3-111a-1]|uniref:Uncharacterized protein n=1 Tax=Gaeumannomyces tritici (strain R3-111a-1) TaxID=644352 RepID=J3NG77_GAET3|nr:hypothetical protein GGTG_00270 [Gaeumannomyces tritici R3-111a-1]EJT80267.1 hypothetical protein GGTG_00270 [Gaeumannomyces tritici R3-111a-1]
MVPQKVQPQPRLGPSAAGNVRSGGRVTIITAAVITRPWFGDPGPRLDRRFRTKAAVGSPVRRPMRPNSDRRGKVASVAGFYWRNIKTSLQPWPTGKLRGEVEICWTTLKAVEPAGDPIPAP